MMLYVARSLFLPSGEECSLKVVVVAEGKVVEIKDFVKEEHKMVFVPEVYLSVSQNLHSVEEVINESNIATEPLFAYSVDAEKRLHLLR